MTPDTQIRADAPPQRAPATPVDDRPPRRRWPRWVLVAAGVALLLAVLLRILGGPASRHTAATPPQPVGVAQIARGDMQVVLTGLGTVTPLATVTVQTQISGQLVSVGYREGQMVRQGDFLAQIDPRPYQVALAQAQATLARDTALLGQARSDLARYVALHRRDSIAEQQLADQQFLVQQDEGTVRLDEASVDSARLNLAYCHIVAPVSGRVGLRLVDPGNYVQTSGATGLAVITELQPISVIFVLPEDNIPAIAQAVASGAKLPVDAYDRTDATRLASGTLLTVDNTVDTTTGTVKLRAIFPNTDQALFPNQFVNARLRLKTLPQVVQAPSAAIQQGEPGSFVFLLQPNNTVAVRRVQTGVTNGDTTQIVFGLAPGDRVVVDGLDRLKDGTPVQVSTPGNSGAAVPAQPRRRHRGAAPQP